MSNPSVPNPMADTPASPPAAAASSTVPAASNESKPPAEVAKNATPQQQALQQQIQAQLQSQLQAQLQAAAAKGKQANITPEMIQAQAQAMVQAAAQAQAVVAAAKNRGGGLVPMNAAQIAALSQIQAQAIVNARPQTALIGVIKPGSDDKPTPQQIQNQIQLQAQALVHAHTQAQITAGIYKGGDTAAAASAAKPKAAPTSVAQLPPTAQPAPNAAMSNPTMSQAEKKHPTQSLPPPVQASAPAPVTRTRPVQKRKQNPLQPAPQALMPPLPAPPAPAATAPAMAQKPATLMPSHTQITTAGTILNQDWEEGEGGVVLPPTSPEFLAQLDGILTEFWAGQLQEMHHIGTDKVETEQDFKNHNDLPLARIKRIMKSDEDVRMISAEAPVLFAKACEMFILDMSLRSWAYSNNNKRKTLQKEDVIEAIQRTDIFDFLVDVIH